MKDHTWVAVAIGLLFFMTAPMWLDLPVGQAIAGCIVCLLLDAEIQRCLQEALTGREAREDLRTLNNPRTLGELQGHLDE